MAKCFSIKKHVKGFIYAFNGIRTVLYTQQNFIVHLVCGLLAIVMGIILDISIMEWTAIIIVISLVLSAEIFNTAIELLVDYISMEKNDSARDIKDISAAAVLIISIGAFATGFVIFVPKLILLL
ncbi:MAG: diacylglycerol kinase family protein [Bacteroidales bacterium]|jgi:diacylglycerol kinase|nr:diacylglycerol kinase family protein [Bacteroidales bacterium]MDG2080690.1 diacylglycerol kinase family protein [Bacteroidales bacterium]|tara:strand:- start:2313 stop:2687 length:375 start_codon:yes stop_codon:yes gene_type:complete